MSSQQIMVRRKGNPHGDQGEVVGFDGHGNVVIQWLGETATETFQVDELEVLWR